jgi:tripartite-type tricarboxylate transporter receptor subunit TctC
VDDLPQTPTVAESGLKNFEAATWFGLLGPAKLPPEIVNQISAEVAKALASPELRKKMDDQGVDVTPSSPAQFATLIQNDIAKWGKVVKESGAKID